MTTAAPYCQGTEGSLRSCGNFIGKGISTDHSDDIGLRCAFVMVDGCEECPAGKYRCVCVCVCTYTYKEGVLEGREGEMASVCEMQSHT